MSVNVRTLRIPNLLIFAVLGLVHAASAFASGDPARLLTVDQGKAEAATLLQKGAATEAYDLYMRLMRMAPGDDEIQLGIARAATKATRWNQAVMAYETLLEKYPREAALYGELANVYMMLGDRVAAERCLAVMRSLDETPRETTDKTLDILEQRYSDFQMRGKIRAGIQYDTNANLGPDSNDLTLGMWQVQLDGAKAKKSAGEYAGANVDMGYRFYRDSPWWLVGDANVFWRGHTNSSLSDLHSRYQQSGRAAMGLRHLTSTVVADIRMKGEIFDYELYQNVSAIGPEGTFLWAADPSFHLIARGNLEKRKYSRVHKRDGSYRSAGLYGRAFFGDEKHEFLFGGRWLDASTDWRDYDYNGWESTARLLFKLPNRVELVPFVSYARESYKGPATVLEADNRRDNRLRAGLGVSWRFDESWALEAGYQYTDNRSNSALYRYDQHFVNVGIAWEF
jgi:tetratricopeptide (TPR) repeat protein